MGYGQLINLARCFSWQHGILHFSYTDRRRVSVLCGPDLPGPQPTHLPGLNHLPGCDNLLRHTIAQTVIAGTGISTCYPSTTPFGLALGPDLPWADEPSPGTLGQSAGEFLPPLSLLMPTFSLDTRPPLGYPAASLAYRRSPTTRSGFRLYGSNPQLRYMA